MKFEVRYENGVALSDDWYWLINQEGDLYYFDNMTGDIQKYIKGYIISKNGEGWIYEI